MASNCDLSKNQACFPALNLHDLMRCLLVLTLASSAHGFVFDNTECMAPPPCICAQNKLVCDSHHFTQVPSFSPSTMHVTNLTIMLPANDLTVLRAHAFRNINTTGATNIEILFQSNKLYSMDQEAFAGIENAVVELHLQDNKLTGIPAALTTLTRLQKLHMQANPITTIDPMVTSLMSPSLEYFDVPALNLTSWPYGLNHMRHLAYLNMYGMPFHRLPLDAFSGFGSYLIELNISGAFSGKVPSAVCFLRSLKMLTVNGAHSNTHQQILQLHEKCRELLSNVASFIDL